MTGSISVPASSSDSEDVAERVLDAAYECVLRWGDAKTTIDDIVARSGVSRATIYRLFPGGRDVLWEALRVRQLQTFFNRLEAAANRSTGLCDVIATSVSVATMSMRDDPAVLAMMTYEPGSILDQLTVEGLPRIVRMANVSMAPSLEPYVDAATATRLVDVVARLTISYFLAPDDERDLGDYQQALEFVTPIVNALTTPGAGRGPQQQTAAWTATETQRTEPTLPKHL